MTPEPDERDERGTGDGTGAGAGPHRMPPQDLGGMFAPPGRSAGLGDLVRKGRGTRQQPTEDRPPPPPAAAPPAEQAAGTGERAVATPPAPAAPPAVTGGRAGDPTRTGTVRITAILVSPAVSARVDKYRRAQRGRTNTSIVLEALDECHDRIPDLVAQARSAAARGRSSLFPARDDHLRLPGSGGVQVQIRPTLAQLDVIDELVERHGLESRSQLVAAVLNEFLPGRKDRVSASR